MWIQLVLFQVDKMCDCIDIYNIPLEALVLNTLNINDIIDLNVSSKLWAIKTWIICYYYLFLLNERFISCKIIFSVVWVSLDCSYLRISPMTSK